MNQNENGLPDSQKGFEEALQLLEAVREMATVMMELIRKPAVNYYNYGTIQNLVCGDYHALYRYERRPSSKDIHRRTGVGGPKGLCGQRQGDQ